MTILKCSDDVKNSRTIWFLILGSLWMLWIINLAHDAYTFAAAEDLRKAAHGQWSEDPRDVRKWIIIRGFVALAIVFVIAHFVALAQAAIVRTAKLKLRLWQSQKTQTLPRMHHSFAVTIKKKNRKTKPQTNNQKTNKP